MVNYMCLVLLLIIACVDGYNNLSEMPLPMAGYQVNGIMGRWFTVYRIPTSIWPATRDDSNLEFFLWFQRKNVIGIRTRFGQKQCTQAFGNMAVLYPPAVKIKLNDGFGGWLSAKSVEVATDYQRFLIYWECKTTSLIGNMCPDPTVVVLARSPKPDKSTIAAVNSVLMNMWGITVNHLRKVLHTGTCHSGPIKYLH